MASFKQMRVDGVIKRADAEKIRWDDIYVEPGFNLEGRNDSDDEDDEALFKHIMSGGMIPDLEVRPREEGGVYLVDGHRRHKQIGRADKAGAPLRDPKDGQLWVCVVQFVGNDVARTKRLLTSNARKEATPLQIAEVYARLSRFGLTPEQIGEEFSKTRQHVDQMLILAGANNDVHQLVKDGKVSATVAVDMVRKHGENAGAFIIAAGDGNGGRKVTAKAVKPWSPPAKVVGPLVDALADLSAGMTQQNMVLLHDLEKAGTLADEIVTVNAGAIWALISQYGDIKELRNVAEQKARDRAAKAAQTSIEGA